MPKPNKLKATGDRNSGYSNTVRRNNITYETQKDKFYLILSQLINGSLNLYEFHKYLKSDFIKLKKYMLYNNK